MKACMPNLFSRSTKVGDTGLLKCEERGNLGSKNLAGFLILRTGVRESWDTPWQEG